MWTLPNIITIVRICFTPVIALLPFIEGYWPKLICFVVFIIAAVITPTPDVATQVVFAVPMLLLYLLGIGISWVFRRRTVPRADSSARSA
jgi:Sec-independent protein secretion pathway component TatC